MNWVDPDDAPELTEEWFATADIWDGDKLIRRGHPKSPSSRQTITIGLDLDVLAHYREAGTGWQCRINEALRRAAGLKTYF